MGLIIKLKGADFSKIKASAGQTFINEFESAGGTLTTTQKQAIISLDSELVRSGLWDYIDVIYPFLGLNSTLQSIGIGNTTKLGFRGTPAFSANGYNTQGTSIADAGWFPSASKPFCMAGWAYPTVASATRADFFGAIKASTNISLVAIAANGGTTKRPVFYYGSTQAIVSYTQGNTLGWMITSFDGSKLSVITPYQSSLITANTTYATAVGLNIGIGGIRYDGNANGYANPINTTFKLWLRGSQSIPFEIGQSINNAINTFLTAIGRG